MKDEAAKYKIPAYSFPNRDSYSIRHAIYHRGAVGLLFYIGEEWWTPSWLPQDINPLRAPETIVGGHEVTGEHWTPVLDGFENSWSDAWNVRGFGDYNSLNYAPKQVVCIDDPTVDFNPHIPTPDNKFKFIKNLSFGMTDPDVTRLQIKLSMPLKYQTGYYGFLTAGYVLAFQISHGIYPTAEFNVGPKTRAMLNIT
jgi:hypothetical protein